ncbi:MAG: lipopolysaccharide heptosyltransferase II [Leptospira sp.]|nr:lipopolysaccharide heptosyltransferase II [Leptospira sp.]
MTDNHTPPKILIIQTAFLGDLILTTPFFQAVANLHPHANIDLIVNKGTESVLEGNPCLRRIIPLDKKKAKKSLRFFWRFAMDLKKDNYDLVYSPHFSFRTSILAWLTGAKIRIGYKESGFSFLHTKTISRPRLGSHEVDKLFSLLFDSKDDYPKGRERRPYLYYSPELVASSLKHLDNLSIPDGETSIQKNYIVVAPSSLWETKRYSDEGFAGVISLILEKTKYPVVLTGSPNDVSLNQKIVEMVLSKNAKDKDRLIDLAGKTKLSELGAIISQARAIVSNDSSPVHYASAFNIPTVLIYGATVPDFGYYGLSDKLSIAEIHGLDCRPCGIHGGKICPKKHFRCMLDQSPESVFQHLLQVLD